MNLVFSQVADIASNRHFMPLNNYFQHSWAENFSPLRVSISRCCSFRPTLGTLLTLYTKKAKPSVWKIYLSSYAVFSINFSQLPCFPWFPSNTPCDSLQFFLVWLINHELPTPLISSHPNFLLTKNYNWRPKWCFSQMPQLPKKAINNRKSYFSD